MKTLSLILLISLPYFAYCQSIRPFKLIDIGTAVSLNKVAGDTETYTNTTAYHLNASYNPDPYLNFVSELTIGELAVGEISKPSGRQFENSFKSLALRTQLQLGYLMNTGSSNALTFARNLYAGAGIGAIANQIKHINRISTEFPDYVTYGMDSSIEIYFPLRIGYEIKIRNSFKETFCKIDFGYQYNFGSGDNIDGFEAGRLKDNFSQLFAGLKICAFGRTWGRNY